MKKLLAICLSVLLLCTAMPFAVVTAAEEPTIALPDLEVKAGDIIEVPILLKNNPGIVSAIVEVEYDSSVMELVSYYDEDEEDYFNQIVLGAGYNSKYVSWGPLGSCLVNFCHGTSKSKNYTDELFATATFKIKEDAAPGTYDLTVVHQNKNFFNCANDGAQQIDFVADHGSITVVANDEPVYTEPTIVLPNLEAEAGDVIEVPILLKNNPGIVSAIVEVEYDKSVLELVSYYDEDEEDYFNQIVLGEGYNNKYVSWGPLGSCLVNFCHGTSKSKNYTDELFATATFKVKEDAAPGTYALTIIHENKNFFNCANDGAVQIDFAAAHGSITIIGNEPEAPCGHEYDADCDPECNLCGELRDVHTEGIIHFDAVEAGCHYNGNIEYWYCPKCECFWADGALTQLTNSKNIIVPAVGGEVVAFEAIEPGCHYDGQIAYWVCYECEQVWQDEALTQLTNIKNVVLPAVGSDNVQHVAATEPTCSSEGNIEYWYCPDCEKYWQDAELTQLTNLKNVIIGTSDHNLIHFDAVQPGCHYVGNIEYWFCSDCEIVWQDEALTQITNLKNVILPAVGGDVVRFEAIQPGCHYEGNIEYWVCYECEQFWQNAELTQLTNSKNVILPAIGSENVQHVEAKEPTCYEGGNIEYWYCPDCEKYWQDAALTQLTNAKNVQLAAIEHVNLVHMPAVEAGCHYTGNIEYWVCYDCETVWQNEALTQITNIKNVVLPALKDTADYVAAKTPTCTENGNVEYWTCAECEQVWQDEALTQLTNLKNVQIAPSCSYNAIHNEGIEAGCHYAGLIENWYCANCDVYYLDADCTQITNYKSLTIPALKDTADYVAAKIPTCTENGNVEYWTCAECEQVWADEALTQLTNIKNVQIAPSCSYNAIHNEGIEAGCHYVGLIENWYCANCDVYYLDAECTQITNYKSLTIPALGGDVTAFEAIEPGCHYDGNIAYWVCYECEQVWQDEALTQLTNIKNVVLPAIGSENLQHVEAVEPTCNSEGNIEYWYCPDCEQYWQDAALTQLTNAKNVKIGVLEHTLVHFEAVEPGCHYTGNIEYWFCSACEIVWQDAELTQITNLKNVIIPAVGGDVVAFEAIEPGCHYDGNIAYWVCYECEQVWQDEALTQLTNIKNVVLPATGSENLQHVEAVEPTCQSEGNIEYWYCPDCEQYWQDEALTQLTNALNVKIGPADHTLVYVEAVEPGCHYVGNIEYWYCTECLIFWQDAELTQVTNSKNVIVPAVGGDVIFFEAVEPGCHYVGNIAYWYCAECEQYWQDEALTQLTNSHNILVAATGSENLKHVEAKAPTATENGNIEYWFCPDCEQYWQDAALTQLTNAKNVIIPATGAEEPDSPVTGDSTVAALVALLTLIASGVAVSVLKNKKRA